MKDDGDGVWVFVERCLTAPPFNGYFLKVGRGGSIFCLKWVEMDDWDELWFKNRLERKRTVKERWKFSNFKFKGVVQLAATKGFVAICNESTSST